MPEGDYHRDDAPAPPMDDGAPERVLHYPGYRLAIIALCSTAILVTALLADTLRDVAASVALGALLALVVESTRRVRL